MELQIIVTLTYVIRLHYLGIATCVFSSPGSGRADVRALAKIMIDVCATNQAWPLLQMFDNLNATDPIPSSRAISAYCSSKYLDITKSLSTASIDLVLKKDQEARSSMQTAISLHYWCFDLLKNRTLPGDMGTYLRNFGVYLCCGYQKYYRSNS